MGALRKAQRQYDNAEPAPVAEADPAREVWLQDMAAQLVAGSDATFKAGAFTTGVTFERFAQAVDEHAMGELSGACSPTVLGRLLLAVLRKDMGESLAVAEEILAVPSPSSLLEQLARDLLVPHAAAGVQAQAYEACEP